MSRVIKENEQGFNRRQFLAGAAGFGLTAGLGGLVACSPQESSAQSVSNSDGGVSTATNWLGSAPIITDEECVETIDAEVVIVGAGCSGTFAAYFAAEGGAKTVLLEAGGMSVGIRSSALAAIDSKFQKEQGVVINKEDIINDMALYADNQCSMELMRSWADNSGEAIDWYSTMVEEAGFTIALEHSMPEGTRYKNWPTGHGTDDPSHAGMDEGVESGVHAVIMQHFAEQGGDYRTNTRMMCLIKDGENVVGLYAENPDGEYIRINASKGVVVATGGYVSNSEMYTALQGELKKSLSGYLTFGTAMGEGIKACLWAGARMDSTPTTMIFDRGVVTPETEILGPEETIGAQYFTFATQPWLKVTKSGKRICNESSPYDYLVHAAAVYPGKAWYPVWDANWKANVERFYTVGCSTLFSREGSNHHPPEFEGVEAQMNSLIEGGYVIKANTLDELAEQLFIDDTDLFKKEVEKHNQWYANQYDAEFGKDPFRLSALDTPPYYGMKVGGLALCTLDGISINTEHQALDENFVPINGLFVIGNDSGSYYASTYPNFGAGTNAGRCVTSGMLVGRTLAQR